MTDTELRAAGFKPSLTCRHANQGICNGCPVRLARELRRLKRKLRKKVTNA